MQMAQVKLRRFTTAYHGYWLWSGRYPHPGRRPDRSGVVDCSSDSLAQTSRVAHEVFCASGRRNTTVHILSFHRYAAPNEKEYSRYDKRSSFDREPNVTEPDDWSFYEYSVQG